MRAIHEHGLLLLLLGLGLAMTTTLLIGCGDDADGSTDGRSGNETAGDASTTGPGSITDPTDPTSAVRPDVVSPDSWDDAQGWTHLGYDQRNHYHNPVEDTLAAETAPFMEKLWTFDVSGFPAGAPVVAEGLVFVLASGGIYAIDLFTGEERWSDTELGGWSTVAYSDGFIYVHASVGNLIGAEAGSRAHLYKLRASDGEIIWGPVTTYDAPRADGTSSPVVAGGAVIVGRSTISEIEAEGREDSVGGMAAFDVETGESLWVYETTVLPENGAMIWSTVGVDLARGIVYATTGNNYTFAGGNSDAFHAVDLQTGERLWVSQVRQDDVWTITDPPVGDTDFGANPIVAEVDGETVIAAGDKAAAFWALDENGQVLWSREGLSNHQTTSTGGILNNGAFDGDNFYVLVNEPDAGDTTWSGNVLLYALDARNDGADVWDPVRFPKITFGMPTVANGLIFVPADDELVILDASDGKELKRFETGGTIAAGGPVVTHGRVVVQSGLQYPFSQALNNNQVHCFGLTEQ